MTTFFIVVGVTVALGWPWIIGSRPPKTAPKRAQIDFLLKGAIIVGVSAVTFVLSGIGAILIVRQARLEYQEAREGMLKELVEGTQKDLRKKNDVQA